MTGHQQEANDELRGIEEEYTAFQKESPAFPLSEAVSWLKIYMETYGDKEPDEECQRLLNFMKDILP